MLKYPKVRLAMGALMAIGFAAAPALAAGTAQAAVAQAPTVSAVPAAVPAVFPNGCGGFAYAPPGIGINWGPWSTNSTCAPQTGLGALGRKTYSWYVPFYSRGSACVQVRGYVRTLPRPGAGHFVFFPNLVPQRQFVLDMPSNVATTFSASCGKSGFVNVPWNGVIGSGAARASSLSLTGVPVNWS
jgi:hypothetical protein